MIYAIGVYLTLSLVAAAFGAWVSWDHQPLQAAGAAFLLWPYYLFRIVFHS